jgi:hypothetical protein
VTSASSSSSARRPALDAARAKDAAQLVDAQTLGVDAHAHQRRLASREGEGRTEVARLLDHHRVARVEECAGYEVEGLLGPVNDEYVVRLAGDPPGYERAGDLVAQGARATGLDAVGDRRKLPHGAAGGAAQDIERKRSELDATCPQVEVHPPLPPRGHPRQKAEMPTLGEEALPHEAPAPLGAALAAHRRGGRQRHERPLAHVRGHPARLRQALVGEVHGVPAQTERSRQLPGRRQLLARQQPTRLDEPTHVATQLAVEGLGSLRVGAKGEVQHSGSLLDPKRF